MATRLKFEVFDVYNQKEHKMNAIGQAQCQVMELLMSVEQVLRIEVMYDGGICGYIIVRAWRVRMGEEGEGVSMPCCRTLCGYMHVR